MKWAGVIMPIVFAVMAYLWVPIMVWVDMNQGLLAFLGLLAAALIQVIPVTANFIQSDRLTPEEAVRLSAQLTKQQRYWIGLLISTIITIAIIVIVSILKERLTWDLGRLGTYEVGASFSSLVTFFLAFVLIKMLAIVGGIMSLQTLRNELVINAARRTAAEQVQQFQQAQQAASTSIPAEILPSDYGRIIRPH